MLATIGFLLESHAHWRKNRPTLLPELPRKDCSAIRAAKIVVSRELIGA
jgi:hypothetical protein